MKYSIYLSGEIHTDWRERITQGVQDAGLDIEILAPVTNHEASDDVGEAVLGKEERTFWRDHKAAKINSLRTMTYLRKADMVIVRFGDKYKQWNAAFDAGFCAAMGKPYITLHDDDIIHPLKEVDAAAMAWATSPDQVAQLLRYVVAA